MESVREQLLEKCVKSTGPFERGFPYRSLLGFQDESSGINHKLPKAERLVKTLAQLWWRAGKPLKGVLEDPASGQGYEARMPSCEVYMEWELGNGGEELEYRVGMWNWGAGHLTQNRDARQQREAERLLRTLTRAQDVGCDAESGYPTDSRSRAHLSVSSWPRPGGVGPAPQCLTKS